MSWRATRFAGLGVAAALAFVAVAGAPAKAQAPAAAAPAKQPAKEPAAEPREAPPTLEAMAQSYFPGTATEASAKRIFRLTRDQIDATVSSLLPRYFGRSVKDAVPRDGLHR